MGIAWEMIVQLDLETHTTLDVAREFLASNSKGTTLAANQEHGYSYLKRVLRRF